MVGYGHPITALRTRTHSMLVDHWRNSYRPLGSTAAGAGAEEAAKVSGAGAVEAAGDGAAGGGQGWHV
jgi:hypothetical protein